MATVKIKFNPSSVDCGRSPFFYQVTRRSGSGNFLFSFMEGVIARHSWASIAKSKNVPLSVISEGMGHDSEATTRIYLASLDTVAIDKANSLILCSL